MRERISRLINVKSLVTLGLTAVFGVMAMREQITGEQFMTVFTTVTAFYFGVQFQKGKGDEAE